MSCLENITALVVEPDLAVAEVLAFMLESEGATVRITHTLEAGIAAFTQSRPSLLICNLKLPDGDGYALLYHCQRLGELADDPIPAIAIADSPWKLDRQRALSAGFHQYLFEPTEYSALMSAINDVLEKKTWKRYSSYKIPS
ncbi:MAG TPA: response regulator [Leptolyngbyaceae cyanobacterium]